MSCFAPFVRYSQILVENRRLTYPTSIWRPIGGDHVGISSRFLASENQKDCPFMWYKKYRR